MRAKSRRILLRAHRYFFGLLAVGGYGVILATLMSFTTTLRVREVAPILLPILAAFFGFSALLYNRARAYPDGKIQRRSLYAADEAMWATVLYLLALLIGAGVTFLADSFNIKDVSKEPNFTSSGNFYLFLLYWLPLFLTALSFFSFAHSLRIFFRGIFPLNGLRMKLRIMKKAK